MSPVIYMMYLALIGKKDGVPILPWPYRTAMCTEIWQEDWPFFSNKCREIQRTMGESFKGNYKLFREWRLFSHQELLDFATKYWKKEGIEDGKA